MRTDGTRELLPSKADRIKVNVGDLLHFNTWGGGGCGDPLEREPEKVAFDVSAGLVTQQGARRYGVVVRDNGSVDANATEQLRASMRSERGSTPLFNRGFTSIDELKRRCKSETGIEAPTQPEFKQVMKRREVKAA